MKRIYNKDNRLESHKIFPYVAWATVLGFAFFVYNLVQDVEARISALEVQQELANKAYQMPATVPLDDEGAATE